MILLKNIRKINLHYNEEPALCVNRKEKNRKVLTLSSININYDDFTIAFYRTVSISFHFFSNQFHNNFSLILFTCSCHNRNVCLTGFQTLIKPERDFYNTKFLGNFSWRKTVSCYLLITYKMMLCHYFFSCP